MEMSAHSASKSGRLAAVVALLLTAVLIAAWQLRSPIEARRDVGAQAVAVDVTSSPASSPSEAVGHLAAQGDGQSDWRIQRNIVIHADSRLIDLRIQAVTPDDDCRWFSVRGEVEQGHLIWRAGNVPTDLGTC